MAAPILPPEQFFGGGWRGGTFPNKQDGADALDAMATVMRRERLPEALVIQTGRIAPIGRYIAVDTEAAAASDLLDSIAPDDCVEGHTCYLSQAVPGHVVTLRHMIGSATGRIFTTDAGNIDLSQAGQSVLLQLVGNVWIERARLGFAGTDGGSTTSSDEVIYGGVRSNGFTLSEVDFGGDVPLVNPLDPSGGDITITVPVGLATPAGRQRVAAFLKDGSAHSVLVVPQTAGGGGGAGIPFAQHLPSSVNGNVGENNGNFGSLKSFVIPAGANVVWGYSLFCDFELDAARDVTVKINGTVVAFTSSMVDTASAWGNLGAFFFAEPLGDVAAALTKNLQVVVGATGGLRSCSLQCWASSDAAQVDPVEGLLLAHSAAPAFSAPGSVTTAGVNRRAIYGCARLNYPAGGVVSVAGGSLLYAAPSGSSTLVGNMICAAAHQAVALAGTATVTFSASASNYWVTTAFALKPASSGGMAIKTVGGVPANITSDQAMILLSYDGINNRTTVRW